MSRLPSSERLAIMSPVDRHGILDVHARERREWIDRLEAGDFVSHGAKSLGAAKVQAKRALARVYKVADEFEVNVGQA